MEIENIDRIDVEAYETFIHKHKNQLHPNHGFMIKVKGFISLINYTVGLQSENALSNRMFRVITNEKLLFQVLLYNLQDDSGGYPAHNWPDPDIFS